MDREVIKIEGDLRSQLYNIAFELFYNDMEFEKVKDTTESVLFHRGQHTESQVIRRKSDGKFFKVTWMTDRNGFCDEQDHDTLVEVFPHQVTKTVFKDEPQNLHRHNDIYFLKALVEAGVDNWVWYDMAVDRYEVNAVEHSFAQGLSRGRKTVKQ